MSVEDLLKEKYRLLREVREIEKEISTKYPKEVARSTIGLKYLPLSKTSIFVSHWGARKQAQNLYILGNDSSEILLISPNREILEAVDLVEEDEEEEEADKDIPDTMLSGIDTIGSNIVEQGVHEIVEQTVQENNFRDGFKEITRDWIGKTKELIDPAVFRKELINLMSETYVIRPTYVTRPNMPIRAEHPYVTRRAKDDIVFREIQDSIPVTYDTYKKGFSFGVADTKEKENTP